MRRKDFLVATLGAASLGTVSLAAGSADDDRASLPDGGDGRLRILPEPTGGPDVARLVAPGMALDFHVEVVDSRASNPDLEAVAPPRFHWRCETGRLDRVTERETRWIPPREGGADEIVCEYEANYRPKGLFARLSGEASTTRLTARARVIAAAPSSLLGADGRLDGFHLGAYPSPHDPRYAANARWPRRYPEVYSLPEGFYRVTEETLDWPISPNFRLGDFAHHYPWETLGLPQYIALDDALVEKLEDLVALLRADGFARKGLKFIYGFRPPSYNLGTRDDDPDGTLKVPFSMHQYGKAVDVIVDDDDDLVLDDLTGDGISDYADAVALRRYVDRLDERYLAAGDPRLGGAGTYAHNDFRARKQSPYVHVDVRGFAGSDGRPIRWVIR